MNDEADELSSSADRAALEAVAAFLPILSAPDFRFGHWEQPPPEPDGTLHFPYFVRGPEADAFIGALGRAGWVTPGFDWSAWGTTDEGLALRAGGEALARATPLQLAQLTTLLIRRARFVEGSLEGDYESGVLTGIAARAQALLDER